jgi:hypothetical protein
MRRRIGRPSFAIVGNLALALSVSGGAWAQGYTHSAVALEGDTAPGTGGGAYSDFDAPSINAPGDVAFHASVAGGSVDRGIFVDSGGTDTAAALPGDSAPGTGGGTYSTFASSTSINASGDVAFCAVVAGGTAAEGIFVDFDGLDGAVAFDGDPAPGTGGGTYLSFVVPDSFSINDSGDVAFEALVTVLTESVFAASGGTDRAVALLGDTAPGTGGGSYSDFFVPPISFNASGDVAFESEVTGSSVFDGIFVDAGGTDTAVALSGETAPGTGGGTYGFFGPPSVNASGDVVFFAAVTGGSVSGGIFQDSGGTDTAVALPGDPAPGTGGGTYQDFAIFPSINDSGDVAFKAFVTGSTVPEGIFLASGGTDVAVALDGDLAPGTGGGSYSFIGAIPAINASGALAFTARYFKAGFHFDGLFKAVPPSPPLCGAGACFNVDLGTDYGVPSTSYGAASGASGSWNRAGLGVTALADTNGAPSDVSVSVIALTAGGSATPPTNDDELLLNDNFFSTGGAGWSADLSRLDPGDYEVFLYAPSNAVVPSGDMTVGGVAVASIPGDTGSTLIEGTSWVSVPVTVADGSLPISGVGSVSGLAGLQVVRLPEPHPLLQLASGLAALLMLSHTRRAVEERQAIR